MRQRWRDSLPIPRLSGCEQSLLRLHLFSAALSGITMGVLSLADTILAKTLSGSELEVTILTGMTGAGFLLSFFWVGLLENRPKAPFIIGAALVGRFGLTAVGVSATPAWFITVIGLAWMGQAMIASAQVSIIQQSYREEHRSRLFGLTVSIGTLLRLLTTVALGKLLDWNESSYVWFFAVAGTAGLAGAWLLARMEPRTKPCKPETDDFAYRPLTEGRFAAGVRSVGASFGMTANILKQDRRFRIFELNFFLYGIAFLSLLPIVPIFLVRELEMDYTNIGLAKGLMAQSGLILLSPLLGRVFEQMKPIRFCARVFACLAGFPLLLIAAGASRGFMDNALVLPLVFASFLFFGIAMSGVNLAWSLSSIHFAGNRDPSAYQSVHSALVGIRGVTAPIIGFLMLRYASPSWGFLLSATLLLIAAGLMALMARSERRNGPLNGSPNMENRPVAH
jgi:MFS family permease